MTGRTHDLAAFTALNMVLVSVPLENMTLATALVAFTANMIGGLAPDLDQPTATLWRRLRGGSLLGKLLSPLLGGHRFISHSVIGIVMFGVILQILLELLSTVLIVDMNVVWWAFMIGVFSHLIMDTFTRDGVPWLFPIPVRLGFPPIRLLRMKTGGLVEKSFVFPVLVFINGLLIYFYYDKVLLFFKLLQ
ncbi:MAG: inner membrane protein [Patescibacteria group bacterium]|nr:inner membrane protein [Patescibacteria group bacterium]